MPARRLAYPLIAALAAAAALWAVWSVAIDWYGRAAIVDARDRARFYRATLLSSLERFEHLPFVLARDPHVVVGLAAGEISGLNRRLEEFQAESGASAIYVMTADGLTVAASNWRTRQTFVGQNYRFRPYFQRAMAGEKGRYFAIGATTGEPGYFIAEGVDDPQGRRIGVIAVKVDLRPLEGSWRDGGETEIVVNPSGVVVLSSRDGWRYGAVRPLTGEERARLAEQRQFADLPIEPLAVAASGDGLSEWIEGERFIAAEQEVGRLGWRVRYLAPYAQAADRAQLATLIAAAALLALAAAVVVLRSERIRRALLLSQRDATALRELNAALSSEIEERRRAEAKLRDAQDELGRKSKMAALGQLSASVSHELSQPLSAMKTYVAAARLNKGEGDRLLLDRIDGLIERMAGITRQMKSFARKRSEPDELVDLRAIAEDASATVRPMAEAGGCRLEVNAPDAPIWLRLRPLRLEQVIVNLAKNAVEAAVEAGGDGRVEIALSAQDGEARIAVSDTGAGLTEEAERHLFEPFFTTKASGDGLGLGLAISAQIVEELAGRLEGVNAAGGGAVFTVELPLAEPPLADQSEEAA